MTKSPQQPGVRLVVIGASAGGTEALAHVLRELPEDFPCVVVVQHILKGFSRMLAETLNRKCRMTVSVAAQGDALLKGHVYIAGDDGQLRIDAEPGRACLRYGEDEKISGHCPSVDALFRSTASLGAGAIGVILTGMGGDGAAGMLEMRMAGAYTIGQDEKSSMIYGMPRMAWQKGGVVRQLPLDAIAGELIRCARARGE